MATFCGRLPQVRLITGRVAEIARGAVTSPAPRWGQASARRRRVYQGHMRLVPGNGGVDDSTLIMAVVEQ